jgi:hypothetical protein
MRVSADRSSDEVPGRAARDCGLPSYGESDQANVGATRPVPLIFVMPFGCRFDANAE